MDTNEDSSSMRLVMTRKPYTITKQRERWSEEEHNRFLEALKLYGRAWQKIEEHIGTKTAVQIRSHAQKFFTKLEKEAVNKGVPIGQTHDIEIPPPRPKRKPSNPYPRKTSVGSPSQGGGKEGKQSTADSPLCQQTHILDLEKEPLLEISEDNGTLENTDEFQNHNSEVSNLPSRSLPNENTLDSAKSGNSCSFIEFVPSLINKDETCKSILATGNCKEGHDNGNIKMLEFLSLKPPQEKTVDNCEISENMSSFCSDEVRARQKYPRHVPVHILDGSLGMSATNITYQESIHQTGGNPTSFAPEQQSHASTPSVQQPFCNFLPILPPIPSQDAYAHASSTFSSLIISALLQNPAAHAAATFAATVSMGEGFPSQHIRETTPSLAAIAGATVAAATAWWAVNGLLPSFSPMVTTQARAVKSDERETIHNADLPECSEALQEQHSVSKSPSDSTSNYEEHEDAKQNAGMSSHGVEEIETVTQLNDLTNFKSKKQVDRSSCGSNTSSSSDVETDALLKHDKGDEEPQGYDINQQSNDRRGRMFSNINDSWKEVSEEGRVAFQALFSRDVLPQSFYMQPASNDEVQRQSDDQHMIHSGSNSRLVDYVPPLINENNKQQGLPRLGVEHESLKTRRTGFKPYKRCSVEAKDSRDGEKSPKRIRVEGEAAAST